MAVMWTRERGWLGSRNIRWYITDSVRNREQETASGRLHMLARDEDILKAAEDWKQAGRGVAVATVVETWGSAPRPVGSNLVIDDQGNFLGSVSGGCVEGAVVTEAMDVIESGK